MPYICYARELGLRKGAWPQSQATCRRAATARSQPTVGFQLALFGSAYSLRASPQQLPNRHGRSVIQRILGHLGLPTVVPAARRAPAV